MRRGFFITGTDTGVGKTWLTVSLMHYFRNRGRSVLAMKPVASGCRLHNGVLCNEDALLLQKHAGEFVDYSDINPYALTLPVAPHIAAAKSGIVVKFDILIKKYLKLQACADVVLVEGVGGWHVPLNEHQDVADLAVALGLPVVLVVGIRLGCINQAILTYNAIKSSVLPFAGWVANCTDADMLCLQENIETLTERFTVPCLGILPYCQNADFEYFAKQLHGSKQLIF